MKLSSLVHQEAPDGIDERQARGQSLCLPSGISRCDATPRAITAGSADRPDFAVVGIYHVEVDAVGRNAEGKPERGGCPSSVRNAFAAFRRSREETHCPRRNYDLPDFVVALIRRIEVGTVGRNPKGLLKRGGGPGSIRVSRGARGRSREEAHDPCRDHDLPDFVVSILHVEVGAVGRDPSGTNERGGGPGSIRVSHGACGRSREEAHGPRRYRYQPDFAIRPIRHIEVGAVVVIPFGSQNEAAVPVPFAFPKAPVGDPARRFSNPSSRSLSAGFRYSRNRPRRDWYRRSDAAGLIERGGSPVPFAFPKAPVGDPARRLNNPRRDRYLPDFVVRSIRHIEIRPSVVIPYGFQNKAAVPAPFVFPRAPVGDPQRGKPPLQGKAHDFGSHRP